VSAAAEAGQQLRRAGAELLGAIVGAAGETRAADSNLRCIEDSAAEELRWLATCSNRGLLEALCSLAETGPGCRVVSMSNTGSVLLADVAAAHGLTRPKHLAGRPQLSAEVLPSGDQHSSAPWPLEALDALQVVTSATSGGLRSLGAGLQPARTGPDSSLQAEAALSALQEVVTFLTAKNSPQALSSAAAVLSSIGFPSLLALPGCAVASLMRQSNDLMGACLSCPTTGGPGRPRQGVLSVLREWGSAWQRALPTKASSLSSTASGRRARWVSTSASLPASSSPSRARPTQTASVQSGGHISRNADIRCTDRCTGCRTTSAAMAAAAGWAESLCCIAGMIQGGSPEQEVAAAIATVRAIAAGSYSALDRHPWPVEGWDIGELAPPEDGRPPVPVLPSPAWGEAMTALLHHARTNHHTDQDHPHRLSLSDRALIALEYAVRLPECRHAIFPSPPSPSCTPTATSDIQKALGEALRPLLPLLHLCRLTVPCTVASALPLLAGLELRVRIARELLVAGGPGRQWALAGGAAPGLVAVAAHSVLRQAASHPAKPEKWTTGELWRLPEAASDCEPEMGDKGVPEDAALAAAEAFEALGASLLGLEELQAAGTHLAGLLHRHDGGPGWHPASPQRMTLEPVILQVGSAIDGQGAPSHVDDSRGLIWCDSLRLLLCLALRPCQHSAVRLSALSCLLKWLAAPLGWREEVCSARGEERGGRNRVRAEEDAERTTAERKGGKEEEEAMLSTTWGGEEGDNAKLRLIGFGHNETSRIPGASPYEVSSNSAAHQPLLSALGGCILEDDPELSTVALQTILLALRTWWRRKRGGHPSGWLSWLQAGGAAVWLPQAAASTSQLVASTAATLVEAARERLQAAAVGGEGMDGAEVEWPWWLLDLCIQLGPLEPGCSHQAVAEDTLAVPELAVSCRAAAAQEVMQLELDCS